MGTCCSQPETTTKYQQEASLFPHLFSPLILGGLTLPNRFIMAPLTRTRADANHVPTAIMAEMYAQRASAGLIIAEATMVAEGHSAFKSEPGIYNAAQVEGWKAVTTAVHAKGGRIFLQLVHGGRASHSINEGKVPVSSTDQPIVGHQISEQFNKTNAKIDYEKPTPLTPEGIAAVVQQFAVGARNAIAAGFDGVEVHGANGYLLDQFLRDTPNTRTDAYGGSVENRARFLLEVVAAVSAAIGANRVGVRISPLNSYNAMADSNPEALVRYVCTALRQQKIAYVHLMRADFFGVQKGDSVTWARESFPGVLIGNMGYDAAEADAAIQSGKLDAVAFGTKFLANPDFVERTKAGKPLNDLRPQFFYGSGPEGYTDYPAAAY